MNTYPYPQNNTSRFLKIAGYILGCAILVGLLLFSGPFIQKNILSKSIGASGTNRDSYQAVFLANNQVYFGKVMATEGDYLTLSDIYYLQVGGSQPGSIQGTGQGTSNDKIFLVKLGNELHGPTDEMHISKSQILFYETLKKDSKVVAAINAYVTGGGGTTLINR